MKINHDVTKARIEKIAELIKKQTDSVAAYNKTKSDLSAYVNYTEEYKSKQLEQAWQVYLNRLEETKAAILERLEDIRKAEKYNEEIIEIDSVELANALAIIEAVKGDVAYNTLLSFAKTFAGRHLALDTIGRAIKKYDKPLSDEFTEYLVMADTAIDKLSTETANLEQSPDTAAVSLKNLYNGVISYGEKLGLIFSGITEIIDESLSAESKTARDNSMHRIMGLE